MAQQQQQQGGSDSGYGPIWIVGGLLILGVMMWHIFKPQIIVAIFYIDLIQARIVSLFTHHLDEQIYVMETIDPNGVNWHQVVAVTERVGSYVCIPYAIVMLGCSAYMYFSNITLKFRREHSMNTLRDQEKSNWKQIVPVSKEDLVKAPIDKGPWAMAMSPMEFAKQNVLLRKDEFAPEDPLAPGLPITAGIKRGSTKSALVLQLGDLWQGYDALPTHYAALAAVFLARANRDRNGANELIDNFNVSYGMGKIDFSGSMTLLQQHAQSSIAQKVASQHAYSITIMASLLQEARADGVIPSCDFLWLKVYDRRLWYMLNSVGRETAFVEICGAFAHWLAEKSLGRGCVVPMVDEAVNALEEAVKEVKLARTELEGLQR